MRHDPAALPTHRTSRCRLTGRPAQSGRLDLAATAMSTIQVVAAVVLASLVFWMVGAYNRLIQLRGDIARQFQPVHEQFLHRNAQLLELLHILTPVLLNAGARLDALRAATQQVDAACASAKVRPSRFDTIASLRLADGILAEARAHLPVQSVPGTDLTDLNAQLQASDATLAFARSQFNTAVTNYNEAIQQFPTMLMVSLFGFRLASTL